MTYRNLDDLYASSPDAYQELLQFMRSEFKVVQTKLALSLEEGDSAMFTHLKHKLFSTLNTLEHTELEDLLTHVKETIGKGDHAATKAGASHLNAQFSQLIQSVDDRLSQLEEARVM